MLKIDKGKMLGVRLLLGNGMELKGCPMEAAPR